MIPFPPRHGAAALLGALTLLLPACASLPGAAGQPAAPEPEATSAQARTFTGVRERVRRITDEERAQLSEHLINNLREGVRAGYVIAIRVDDLEAYSLAIGAADVETGEDLTTRSLHRIASMTKPVTAAAIMMLVEDGAIALDDPLSATIPAFADMRVASERMAGADGEVDTVPAERPITIRDLLTHTSGVGYVFDEKSDLGAIWMQKDAYSGQGDLAARIDRLAEAPLYFQPGERWFYSFSNDILGRVIEIASGQRLEAFFQTRIFQPLGMTETTFFPSDEQRERLVALHTHSETGALVRVADSDDPTLGVEVEAGGAGLYSTAEDYLRFGQMLANGGILNGVRVLSQDSVAAMTSAQVPLENMPAEQAAIGLSHGFSLGVATPLADGSPPEIGLPRDFGWGGYFDTDFFVSPTLGVVAVTLSQELPSETTPPGGARDQRAILYEIVRD